MSDDKALTKIADARRKLAAAEEEYNTALESLPAKEPGLISLMYWVTNDEDYKYAFHTEENLWSDKFKIKEAAQTLISAIGDARYLPEAKATCLDLFDRYLTDELLAIWDDGARRSDTAPPEALGRELIAFMYWVRHHKKFNEDFRRDPEATMDRFFLKEDAKALLRAMNGGSESERRKLANKLFDPHLVNELLRKEPPPVFW